jgi:ubiquinone/menaquinone biosynthesis C-methylase UbiE
MAEPVQPSDADHYGDDFFAAQLHYYQENAGGQAAAHVESVVGLVAHLHARRVLDLGCSIGTYALHYARLGRRTVGVDASPRALVAAQGRAREEGLDNCAFVLADITQLSFPKDSFDLVVASDIFEHLPMNPLETCIKECWRVLSPGGRFVVQTTPTKYEHMFDYTRGYVPLLPLAFLPGRLLDRIIEAYDWLRYEVAYRVTRGETRYEIYSRTIHPNPLAYAKLRQLLLEAGFVVERYMVGNLEQDLSRGSYVRATRLFPQAKNVYKRIWALCRKPYSGETVLPAHGDHWGATEIRESAR